jgi:hypothetical protein
MLTNRKLYQIYTEDKNYKVVEEVVSDEFSGFSIIQANGFYKRVEEDALIIEIIGDLPTCASADNLRYELERVRRVAKLIKERNKQEVVILTVTTIKYEEV